MNPKGHYATHVSALDDIAHAKSIGDPLWIVCSRTSLGIALIFRRRKHLWKQEGRETVLGVADQCVVSGTSFLSTVLVGRSSSARDLMLYVMGMAILPILVSVLDAIVIGPYLIHLKQNKHRSEVAGGSALVHCGLLALCATCFLFFCGRFLLLFSRGGYAPQALQCASFIAGPVLCREFFRRFALANRRPAASLALDLCIALLQISTLSSLAYKGFLTADTAFLSWGITSTLVASIFIGRTHRSMRFSRIEALNDLRTNFRMGKWLLPGQVALIAQYGAPAWLAGLLFRPHESCPVCCLRIDHHDRQHDINGFRECHVAKSGCHLS